MRTARSSLGRRSFALLMAPLFSALSQRVPVHETVEVRMIVYSGEPDPRWTFTAPQEMDFLRKAFAGLEGVETPEWPSLGWRGFRLVSDRVLGVPGSARVFRGVICIEEDGESRCYRDRHGLERWLVEQAKQRGFGRTIEQ